MALLYKCCEGCVNSTEIVVGSYYEYEGSGEYSQQYETETSCELLGCKEWCNFEPKPLHEFDDWQEVEDHHAPYEVFDERLLKD